MSLKDVQGEKATLIMFICNHCPYVKAIIRDLAEDCNELKRDGVN
ncbi:MAG: redoxin domain-containing protein, partial [Candidatus Thermoplasmatota archaeon]|nr:redoxin domain-containing protein [Candidatus Thermoplasmatota archaeon]